MLTQGNETCGHLSMQPSSKLFAASYRLNAEFPSAKSPKQLT